LFDHLTLVILAFGAVLAVRNITWFGLAVLVLLPRAVSTLLPAGTPPTRRPTLNLSLAALSLVILVGSVVAVSAEPESWFERSYDHRAVRAIAALVDRRPGTLIYAGDRFGDWLLWQDPRLAGRIAYDIRFELLTSRRLQEIADITQIRGPHDRDILAPYGVLVLDSTAKLELARPGTHVIMRGKGVVVATTSTL
jgi:hypothetical protein